MRYINNSLIMGGINLSDWCGGCESFKDIRGFESTFLQGWKYVINNKHIHYLY